MKDAIQWVRSLIFIGQMYVAMLVLAVVFLIPMLLHRRFAVMACKTYCRWVIWTASWMVGLKVEVRGTPPTDPSLIVAKHQSFLDILVIFGSMPHPKFIMKKILMYSPILGQYAMRLGCIPVSRGKRAQAVKKMMADVDAGRSDPGQLVIYPQGTRVPPGEKRDYKMGSGILYRELQQPSVPVAVNVGVYWPKHGIMRKKGTAVVEFLPSIAPGLPIEDYMRKIELDIEGRSDVLHQEALLDVARNN